MRIKLALPKQLPRLLRPLKPLLRHHYFISITLLLIIVIVAVFIVNQTFQAPSDDSYRDEKLRAGISGKFDQATIDKIERLQRSSDQATTPVALPVGIRVNPFVE